MSEEPKLWGKCPKIIRVRNCKSDSPKAKNTSDPHHYVQNPDPSCLEVLSYVVESNEKMVIQGA